ncbi:HU family DNA-binding protein [Ancylomarina sp. DW003]|nr:HU family DNA-binding protein [Ancylomarina sp. DW003]MDE5421150.1 HU family DNA-binding protein [Ancylomarina sp. DW003]
MTVKYKVIERGQPGVVGGGEKKFYASNMISGNADIDELTEGIEKISTVSGADIRAVLYALTDVIPSMLADGKSVKLGDIGSYRVSISSEGEEKAEDINANSIKKSKIIFTPGKKLKEMLSKLKYSKM